MRTENPDRADTSKVQSTTSPPRNLGSEPPDRTESIPSDEEVLFGGGSGARLFGEGSYAEGGSNEEGNWEERDSHPHGRYGHFSDASGFGATELLGDPEFGEERSSEGPDTRPESSVDP